MDLGLKGKIAIVGGASMGIGYGIARLLAAEGACVAITARREPALLKAAGQLRAETGAVILPIQGNGQRADDCARIVETVVSRLDGIDIVVNNDGAPPLGDLAAFDDAAWAKAVEQNLMYVVRMARLSLPHMVKRGGGSILNIAALSALQPAVGFGLSVATWNGVIGFAKTLSLEVAAQDINVNTICPGYIETQRLEKVFSSRGDSAAMRASLISEIPMQRIGTVEDIAHVAAMLVSPAGRYVTGQRSRSTADCCDRCADGRVEVMSTQGQARHADYVWFSPTRTSSAMMAIGRVCDAAVVGVPHPSSGSAVAIAVVPQATEKDLASLTGDLSKAIVAGHGSPFRPVRTLFVSELPKTRNMKTMRRLIRSALTGEPTGDLSALVNPEAFEELKAKAAPIA